MPRSRNLSTQPVGAGVVREPLVRIQYHQDSEGPARGVDDQLVNARLVLGEPVVTAQDAASAHVPDGR